jgi:hypothetical protein
MSPSVRRPVGLHMYVLSIQFCEHGKGGVHRLVMMLIHVFQVWSVAVRRCCMFTVHVTNVHNLLFTFCHYEESKYHGARC